MVIDLKNNIIKYYKNLQKTVGDLNYNDYFNDVINELFTDSDDEQIKYLRKIFIKLKGKNG